MASLERWWQARAWLWVGLALAGGCSEAGSATSGDLPCAPLLASAPRQIALATVLGIGRHADGTLYVLDQDDTGTRVFVSEGAKLKRKEVSGSGSGHLDSGDWYVASVLDPSAPFILKVDDTNGARQMGVVRGAFTDRDFTIGQTGDVLEVQGAATLDGLIVLDLPDGVYVEYWAHLPDGRTLVVLRPDHDWGYDDFRLFLGTDDQMRERPVLSVQRARDGGTTTIVFTLDGARATAFFPSSLSGVSEASLTVANATPDVLTTEPAGSAPTEAAYFCL
jgi:hypothetical protein